MLNRRNFLASFAAAFVPDPERLLWVRGRKLISIPKPQALTLTEIVGMSRFPDPEVEAIILERLLQGYRDGSIFNHFYVPYAR